MLENSNSDLAINYYKKQNFKVIETKKRLSKPKHETKSKSLYTLNCEKRLDNFKKEYSDFFDAKINQMEGGFEKHYKNVLNNLEKERKSRTFKVHNLETEMKQEVLNDATKGTLFYMDSDVLTSNIVDLNE
jgi:hypothetical protein